MNILEENESVHGFVGVTTEADIRDRGKFSLRTTLAHVGRVMMQNGLDNTMLVVTHSFVDDRLIDATELRLHQLLNVWKNREFPENIDGQGLDVEERRAIQYALNVICRDPSGVAIIRADHPEDRLRFEARLNQMEAVDKSEYNFDQFSRNLEKFWSFIQELITEVDGLKASAQKDASALSIQFKNVLNTLGSSVAAFRDIDASGLENEHPIKSLISKLKEFSGCLSALIRNILQINPVNFNPLEVAVGSIDSVKERLLKNIDQICAYQALLADLAPILELRGPMLLNEQQMNDMPRMGVRH
jgi:hypothetical protein